MPNASRRPAPPREPGPGRIPRRGAAALVLTTAGVALLASFHGPDGVTALGVGGGTLALVDTGQSAAPTSGTDPTTVPTVIDPTTQPQTTAGPRTAAADPTPRPTPKPTSSKRVVDGKQVDTRYGIVQVEITVTNRGIADVKALQLPTGRTSSQISAQVAPWLREEALQAQSANIDIISGATYTSDGYAQSLQSALDRAGV